MRTTFPKFRIWIFFAITSAIGAFFLMRIYLQEAAGQFAQDFERQNISALAAGDTYQLANRLGQLSSAPHWTCVKAKVGEKIFFDRTRPNGCSAWPFSTQVKIRGPQPVTHAIVIEFTLGLSPTLQAAAIFMFGAQILLLFLAAKAAALAESERTKSQIALSNLAAQVAHDIRSPLSALQAIVDNKTSISAAEFTSLVKSTTSSIRRIADELISKYRDVNGPSASSPPHADTAPVPAQTEWIAPIVQRAVSQKRAQHFQNRQLVITLDYTSGGYAAFCYVDALELERVISNLLNNAIEAQQHKGEVKVLLDATDDSVVICIQDTGVGISPEILSVLGQRGVSINKPGGAGLGLSHARRILDSWNGRLVVESRPGKGTNVSVGIPSCGPPNWFISYIPVEPGTTIVVVDDDPSIIERWRLRITSSGMTGSKIVSVKSPSEALTWFRSNLGEDAFYLVDYEYQDRTVDGLDLIQRLGIQSCSALVTSRADELDLISRCERFGIRLLPKSMIDWVHFKKFITSENVN